MVNLYEKFFNAVRTGKPEDASLSIDKLIESDPLNPNHYIKKGDLYQKKGSAFEAVNVYHKAADLMIQQGFHKKALAVLKIILRIDPADQIALYNMGKVLSDVEASERLCMRESGGECRDIAEYLQDVYRGVFFTGLTSEEIGEILDRAQIKQYEDGEAVLREGDSGDSFYVIKEGHARVISFFMGKQIELAVLKRRGDVFGEASFLTGRPRSASVIAAGELLVCEFSRQTLEGIIKRKPKITEYLNEIYHVRVIETINKVKGKTSNEKVLQPEDITTEREMSL